MSVPPLANHVSPDHYLHLEVAQEVTRAQVAQAWEDAYAELKQKLLDAGQGATLYVVFGLQGAGKSTWVARHALGAPHAIFLDGPLPSRRHRQRALRIAAELGCPAVAVWINTPLELAMARNASRRGLACIQTEAILHVFEHLEPPTREEGFSDIIEVLPPDEMPEALLPAMPWRDVF